MIELQLDEFNNVRELFEEAEYSLNSLAVIAGVNSGRIWVDSKENPTSGMMVDNIWSYYLVGNPNNKEFNASIAKVLKNETFPAGRKEEEKTHGDWVFYYEQKDWFEKVESELGINDPVPLKRYHYIFEELLIPDWRAKIPKGFIMRKIDDALLKQKKLENIEEIERWIISEFESEENFLETGFGFCLVEDDKTIVSWCIADWVVEEKAEIGIETAREYRKRGFATLCTAATVEYCQEKDYQVGWHCNQDNEGSWRTAEKVGFVRKKSYQAANGLYDEKIHLFYNAWYKGLILEKPEVGLQYIKKLIEMEKNRRNYSLYAELLIKLKEYSKAIEALNEITKIGHPEPTRFKEDLETRELFQELRQLEEWKTLMKKVESLIKE